MEKEYGGSSKFIYHKNVAIIWSSNSTQFSLVQSPSHVWLFVTPWITARQASLSITNSQSLLKFMPIELVMPSNHLILCRPLLLLPWLIGIYLKKKNTIIQKDTCTPMFLAVLFTICTIWKQPQFPPTDEWTKKIWDIYIMKYYLPIKNKMWPFITIWMKLESIRHSEICQERKISIISFICEI